MTQDEIIKQINEKYGIKEDEDPCWNCFSSNCSDKCNSTKTSLNKVDQNKIEENNDDEDYPQNNICYECGKQLKWEHMCPDCGVSNDFDFGDYIHPVYADTKMKNTQEEDYPQNNICYECGKQLKWEHICPDCGFSNIDNNEEEQIDSAYDNSEYMEKSIESFMKEIRESCNETDSGIYTVNKDITESHDKNIPEINNGRDHKTMQSLNSDNEDTIKSRN